MSFIILTFVMSIYRRADTHKSIWSVDSNLPYTFLIPFQTSPTYKDTKYNSQFQIYCEHFYYTGFNKNPTPKYNNHTTPKYNSITCPDYNK